MLSHVMCHASGRAVNVRLTFSMSSLSYLNMQGRTLTNNFSLPVRPIPASILLHWNYPNEMAPVRAPPPG
jgi:hypothetical protein